NHLTYPFVPADYGSEQAQSRRVRRRGHGDWRLDMANRNDTAAKQHAAQSIHAMRQYQHSNWFNLFAFETAHLAVKPRAFLFACAIIFVWAATGPMFHFSDTWQLVINTGTTIITFLMVFLIQNTQNRDTLALQIKLAELIISMRSAHNKMATIEDLSDAE